MIGRVDLEAGQAAVLERGEVLARRVLEIGAGMGEHGHAPRAGRLVQDLDERQRRGQRVERELVAVRPARRTGSAPADPADVGVAILLREAETLG